MLVLLVFWGLIFCGSVSCSRSEADASRAPADAGPCSVTRVVDGDTVYVECTSQDWAKVRLLNIDTPERGQDGFDEASAALETLVGDRDDVCLLFELVGKQSYGKYKRPLAYLLVDGSKVNVEMVRLGFSEFYTKYGDGRFPRAFRAAARVHRGGG